MFIVGLVYTWDNDLKSIWVWPPEPAAKSKVLICMPLKQEWNQDRGASTPHPVSYGLRWIRNRSCANCYKVLKFCIFCVQVPTQSLGHIPRHSNRTSPNNNNKYNKHTTDLTPVLIMIPQTWHDNTTDVPTLSNTSCMRLVDGEVRYMVNRWVSLFGLSPWCTNLVDPEIEFIQLVLSPFTFYIWHIQFIHAW